MPVTMATLPDNSIEVQRGVDGSSIPADTCFLAWAGAALAGAGHPDATLCIRIVDAAESRALNARYRGRDAPANVLSFPASLAEHPGAAVLGDVAICADVVAREAGEQGKAPAHHWAHLVVHGVLHLLGYDHGTQREAAEMECLETRILVRLGIGDPYEGSDDGTYEGR